MTRWYASLLFLGLAACADPGPPAPPLAHPLSLYLREYEEPSPIMSVIGALTLKLEPDGEAESRLKRQLLTDIDRRRTLSNQDRWELHTKVEAWAAVAGSPEPPAPKAFGILTYGDLKVSWEKDASLKPELADLVEYLKKINLTLQVVRKRG
jgi:hypothetical protein